jgi:GNAT superfamily N-acetyltransferase
VSPELAPSAGQGARIIGSQDRTLLSRVEDAGLNASAPPQQRWMDGWMVRTCPGKAQRARCINAVSAGCLPVAKKLAACAALYRELGLPLIVRITPFTQPPELDAALAAAGYALHDDTRVMVLPRPDAAPIDPGPAPAPGGEWVAMAADDYADAVGAIRGTPPEARRAHAERLCSSPVPYSGFALVRQGEVLACGQFAREGDLVGLYDVATRGDMQRQGLATWLCKRLLTVAKAERPVGTAYLQVGVDNHAARRIYARMGFADAYTYHYRLAPTAADATA